MGKAVEKRTTEGLTSTFQACPTDRGSLSQQRRAPQKGGQVLLLAVENRPSTEQRLQSVALPSRRETRLAQGLGIQHFTVPPRGQRTMAIVREMRGSPAHG